jgi:hypothetical protein
VTDEQYSIPGFRRQATPAAIPSSVHFRSQYAAAAT